MSVYYSCQAGVFLYCMVSRCMCISIETRFDQYIYSPYHICGTFENANGFSLSIAIEWYNFCENWLEIGKLVVEFKAI